MNKLMLGISMLVLALLSAEIGVAFPRQYGTELSLENSAAAIMSESSIDARDQVEVFLDPGKLVASATQMRESALLATSTAEATDQDKKTDPVDISAAGVKIECIQKGNRYNRTVSGTGFMINAQGVMLTNAHVAQFLLLKNAPDLGETTCQATIGTGTGPVFDIALLYISPSWLLKNASLIDNMSPKGTGESDFALVYVTGRRDGESLGSDFAYLPPATNPLSKSQKGAEVRIMGYPKQEDRSAPQLTATTTITDLYTFGSGYADIFSLASSTLGHQGASGGPVVDEYGRAIGVITTKDSGTTVLNAITTAHIDRRLLSEVGFDLTSYSQGNIDYKAKMFNETISPILQEILAGYLTEPTP